jgi:polyisoprenyl-phosphate glycosyltransferase
VIVPVYGNAATLRELHARLCAAIGPDRELLFVDDASPDESLTILEALATGDRTVGVLALARNVGQNRAILAGLAYVRGSSIAMLDADLQDPPEAIPALLAALQEQGGGAVFAGRRAIYQGPLRRLSSTLFKALVHRLTGRRVPRDAGLFLAISGCAARRLLSVAGPRPYLVALLGRCGVPLRSIPVERAARREGRSAYSALARLRLGLAAVLQLISTDSGQPEPVELRAALGAPFASPGSAER